MSYVARRPLKLKEGTQEQDTLSSLEPSATARHMLLSARQIHEEISLTLWSTAQVYIGGIDAFTRFNELLSIGCEVKSPPDTCCLLTNGSASQRCQRGSTLANGSSSSDRSWGPNADSNIYSDTDSQHQALPRLSIAALVHVTRYNRL